MPISLLASRNNYSINMVYGSVKGHVLIISFLVVFVSSVLMPVRGLVVKVINLFSGFKEITEFKYNK